MAGGMVRTLKILIRRWQRSLFKSSDLCSILFTWVTGRHPVYFSTSIKKTLKGKLLADGLCFIGIFSNKIALDPKARGQFRIGKGGFVRLGNNIRIARGCTIFINGKLSIGENSYIQPNANIVANNEISIGKNCAISWNFQALDDDLHTLMIDGTESIKSKKILIGDKVWIGVNTIILKGSEIGNHCVVASGSVVSGIFPDNVLIGGVPAKIIRQNVNWN